MTSPANGVSSGRTVEQNVQGSEDESLVGGLPNLDLSACAQISAVGLAHLLQARPADLGRPLINQITDAGLEQLRTLAADSEPLSLSNCTQIAGGDQ